MTDERPILDEAHLRVLMLARESIARSAQDATAALGQDPHMAKLYATLAVIAVMLGDGRRTLAEVKPKIAAMLGIAETLALEAMEK